jgi:hypothetical protein
MGTLDDYMIFCQNNPQLSPSEKYHEFYRNVLKIDDGHDLTFEEIDILTGGRLGKFNVPCPYCGSHKPWSSTFSIERRNIRYARWHCFYCNRTGAVSRGPLDPEEEAAERKRAAALGMADKAERTERALKWWNDAVPIIDTAKDYFRARDINELPPDIDNVMRWHPACPFNPYKQLGVMLALFRDAKTDKPVAILRTYIMNTEKGFAQRKALGPIDRAYIKLWPVSGDTLTIGEGLETALWAAQHTWGKTALKPAWAASVACNMGRLPLIRKVKNLMILGDNDETSTGYLKSFEVYDRYKTAKREAEIIMPKQFGFDFNDMGMMEKKYGRLKK